MNSYLVVQCVRCRRLFGSTSIVVYVVVVIAVTAPTATAATAHHDIELPSLKSRRRCPIDADIEVNIILFGFNWTIVSYKLTATKELSPRSRILRQAGDNEKCDNIHS